MDKKIFQLWKIFQPCNPKLACKEENRPNSRVRAGKEDFLCFWPSLLQGCGMDLLSVGVGGGGVFGKLQTIKVGKTSESFRDLAASAGKRGVAKKQSWKIQFRTNRSIFRASNFLGVCNIFGSSGQARSANQHSFVSLKTSCLDYSGDYLMRQTAVRFFAFRIETVPHQKPLSLQTLVLRMRLKQCFICIFSAVALDRVRQGLGMRQPQEEVQPRFSSSAISTYFKFPDQFCRVCRAPIFSTQKE